MTATPKPTGDHFLYRDVKGEVRVIVDPAKARPGSPFTKWQLHQAAHPDQWRPKEW